MSRFEGKNVLITGSAHGIGKQIAIDFAKEGANIVILDFNYEEGVKTANEINEYGNAIFIKADVSNYSDILNAKEIVEKKIGKINILVLCAGIAQKAKVNEITIEDWEKVININLTGLFTLSKAFYEDLINSKGSIVYISSGSALSGTGGGVSYPASKAGGEGLMRGLAKEMGPLGVNVNSISPRLIDSGDMMRVNYPTQDSLDNVLKKIPVGRFGLCKDVSNLTLFLADKDNSYIHGQNILLDGGRTIA
ncbi:oxidoreductase, short chain dehydrogenase/reductase family protein [Anaerococcus lactolyticus ATCC 51172]|uniref:Oxidoreductase, short chain dehydrogenase/reductase family protein n=1 Tax=Anaerococcus lactolyticus ATCC 51172 TaxID=525254 RepID=C2BGE9_9FIRM|nr:SDR family oxidoreductase [Anaerococcus lactolyticus]EEI86076.1 oxidoreductase, short chain dehydrogenase/reductase family protein [Anaerococcus lactolyticus ATCC 51172]